jgi:hypothetical protein
VAKPELRVGNDRSEACLDVAFIEAIDGPR